MKIYKILNFFLTFLWIFDKIVRNRIFLTDPLFRITNPDPGGQWITDRLKDWNNHAQGPIVGCSFKWFPTGSVDQWAGSESGSAVKWCGSSTVENILKFSERIIVKLYIWLKWLRIRIGRLWLRIRFRQNDAYPTESGSTILLLKNDKYQNSLPVCCAMESGDVEVDE